MEGLFFAIRSSDNADYDKSRIHKRTHLLSGVNNANVMRSVLKIAKIIARIGANRKKILAISVPGPITEGINLNKIPIIKPINRMLKTQKIASITIKINKRNSVRIIRTEQKTLLYKITANDIQTAAWDFHKLMGSDSN